MSKKNFLRAHSWECQFLKLKVKPTSAASAAAFASAFAKAFEFAIEFQSWRPSTSSAQQLVTLEMLVPLSPFVVGPGAASVEVVTFQFSTLFFSTFVSVFPEAARWL